MSVSGSHRRSVELIAANEADVAAVDCVTFAHLQSIDPALTSGVRVLSWTPPSPCLPFVTARSTSAAMLARLQVSACCSGCRPAAGASAPATAPRRSGICAPDATLKRVLKLERRRWICAI